MKINNFINHIRHPFSSDGVKLKKWEKGIAIGGALLLAPFLIFPGVIAFYSITYAFKASKEPVHSSKPSRVAERRFSMSETKEPPIRKTEGSSKHSGVSAPSSHNYDYIHESVRKAFEENPEGEELHENSPFERIKATIKENSGNWMGYLDWAKDNDYPVFTQLFGMAEYENPEEMKQIVSQLDEETLKDLFPDDVKLILSNGEISSNKRFLSHYIPYFEAMFGGSFPDTQEAKLQDFEQEVFTNSLDFLVFHEPLKITDDNLSQYLELAAYLSSPQLEDACEEWIVSHIEEFDNVRAIFSAVSPYKLSPSSQEKIWKEQMRRTPPQLIFDKLVKGQGSESLKDELEELLPFTTLHCPTDDHLGYITTFFPNITRLSLKHAEITDEGWQYLVNLHELQDLDLEGTFATDDQVANIASLSNLQTLNLKYTRITDAGLAHITNLNELQHLNLGNIPITDAGLVHITNLNELQHLNLGNTTISDAGLAHVVNWKKLKTLNLSNNKGIKDAGLVHIAQLQELETLNLKKTKSTDKGLASIANLANLQNLDLSNNDISDAGLTHIANLTELRSLNLENVRKITDTGLANITALNNLQNLNLSSTHIRDGLAHIARLNNLQTLNLSNTTIGDADLVYIAELINLRSLSLRGAWLSGFGLANLASLNKLQTLDLSFTRIDDEGLSNLPDLPMLKDLFLGATNITDESLDFISSLQQLQNLSLSNTVISNEGFAQIAKLKGLQGLSLHSSRIKDSGLAFISTLTNLRDLDLSLNHITDRGLAHTANLQQLQKLYIKDTEITEEGLVHLAHLGNLEELYVSRRRINQSDIARHLTHLQNLKVYRH